MAETATSTNLVLNAGDSVFFGEYPQSQVAEEDAGELIVWINQLKSTCGLSLFNSDGTSNIEYTDTTSANHVSKININQFTLDEYCKNNSKAVVENPGVLYTQSTGYFTLKQDMGVLKKGDKVKEYTSGMYADAAKAGINSTAKLNVSPGKSSYSGSGLATNSATNPYVDTVGAGKTFYFKVEPIEWVVITSSEANKEAQLISKNIIDAANEDINYVYVYDRENHKWKRYDSWKLIQGKYKL